MPGIDHIIVKVNDLAASVDFYTQIMGFADAGENGPFRVIRISRDCQLQLAPWGTDGFEHYAFAVDGSEFDAIFTRVKAAGIDYGPTFDRVGDNGPVGREPGARGEAPTVYFMDPNKHLIEIRSYELTGKPRS